MTEKGHIDSVRYPNFAALAASSTWYRNATTMYDITDWSVPAILSGQLRRADQLPIRAGIRMLLIITDGEGYRENMYYFYQRRLDGITFENMVKKTFGTAGFGIECARVVGEIKNPRCQLARWWKQPRR